MISIAKGQNKMKRVIAILLTILIIAALSACGSSESDKETASTPDETKATAESEGVSLQLQEFLDSEVGKKMESGFVSGAESDKCTARCYVDGNELIFETKYTIDIPESSFESVKESILKTMESEETVSSFDSMKALIGTYVSSDFKLRCVFLSSDGAVIAEKYM